MQLNRSYFGATLTRYSNRHLRSSLKPSSHKPPHSAHAHAHTPLPPGLLHVLGPALGRRQGLGLCAPQHLRDASGALHPHRHGRAGHWHRSDARAHPRASEAEARRPRRWPCSALLRLQVSHRVHTNARTHARTPRTHTARTHTHTTHRVLTHTHTHTHTHTPPNALNLIRAGRRSDEDFIYEDELLAACRDGTLTSLHTAFSRQSPGGAKVYVQHQLKEQSASVWDLIHTKGGHFYVCGGTSLLAPLLLTLPGRGSSTSLSLLLMPPRDSLPPQNLRTLLIALLC